MKTRNKMRRACATALSAALALGMVMVSPAEARAAVKPKKLTVTCAKKTLYIGGTSAQKKVTLKVKVTPKKASKKVTYKSSKKKVATVSKTGKVTAKSVGKTTITVTSKSNKKLKKKIKITVKMAPKKNTGNNSKNTSTPAPTSDPGKNPSTSAPTSDPGKDPSTSAPAPTDDNTATDITLNKSELKITKTGKNPYPTSALIATVGSADKSSEVSWTSSNEEVATVDGGVVTAVHTGTTTITASKDNLTSASCTVIVRKTTVAIHDPSIFNDPNSDNYYIIGTEMSMAVSADLQAWSTAPKTGADLFKDGLSQVKPLFDYTTADATVGNLWAGDLIYNTAMKKYCMYICATCKAPYGYRTAIGMCSSDEVTGPYEWKGMIVCADFTKGDIDSTNIRAALGLSATDQIPARYYDASEEKGKDSPYFKANFPDCIDPAPFYGPDGTLYMVYGSFTCKGGIHILKLDPNTGLRSPSCNYDYKEGECDPYFGKKITNEAGEGPYIQQVKTDKSKTGYYYYLWTSSGLLRGTGNYHMSMFRSENPDGPFVDMAGTKATDGGGNTMMYNYKYSFMPMAYTAMGGNSAMVDDDGKIYLVYHNKFEDNSLDPGTHMVKVHQMFVNEDGWLVSAPFEYHGETIASSYADSAVAGDYELVIHKIGTALNYGNYNYNKSVALNLSADGKVSGALTGTWKLSGSNITITAGSTTYKGVVLEQYEDDGKTTYVTSQDKTLTMTFAGSDGVMLSASKITATDQEATDYDAEQISIPTENVSDDFALTVKGLYGSAISWVSNHKAVTIDGTTAKVDPQVTATDVTLTATVTKGSSTTKKTYTVKVPAFELKVPAVVGSSHIDLPDKTADGTGITWTTSNDEVIKTDGTVTQPETEYANVTLTADIAGVKQTYEVVVLPKTPATPIYQENFQGVTDASKYMTSQNYQAGVNIRPDADYGDYLEFSTPDGVNSRGAVSDFGVSDKATGIYTVEFDIMLRAGNNQATEFALSGTDEGYINNNVNDGIASGYIFKLSCVKKGEPWTLGKDSLELPDNWVHMKVIVDAAHGKAVLTITSSNGLQTYYDSTVAINGSGVLKGFYLRSGRYNALFKMDNIKVY